MTEMNKPKRPMKSFEADPDVGRMLERACWATIQRSGVKLKVPSGLSLKVVCNEALRAWLTAKGYARKKELAP
jgi:hypothetical protein